MCCKNCGGDMSGDGYSEVRHCEDVDVIGEGYEPDANPVYCEPEKVFVLRQSTAWTPEEGLAEAKAYLDETHE